MSSEIKQSLAEQKPTENVSAFKAPFSISEYQNRVDKTRQAMNAAGLQALWISDPSNIAWLTGYDGWSFYTHQGVLLTLSGQPLWWGRYMDSIGAGRTVWLAPENIHAYGDHFVQSALIHPMQDLAELIKSLGLEQAVIGVELENYYYSAKAHLVLTESLPQASFKDATALVNWQRLVKSPQEIEFIRKAARISGKIMRKAIERAQEGVRKNDIVADIMHAGITGVDQDWGDYPAIVPLTPSGQDASAAHLTWNGQPMRRDEATFFELSGCYRRYHAPVCRTVYLGEPADEVYRAEQAQLEGIAAGLEAARAGNRTCDIANAFMAVLKKYGISRQGRMGYPVGLSYPPDWGERSASIRSEDETELQAGMVFHFMPALWMDSWGLGTTETILIRDQGAAECLVDVERKLFVKEN